MLRLFDVCGYKRDPEIAKRLHDIAHRGGLETIWIDPGDAARRRLRVQTDRGSDCAIQLPRSQRLEDGAVLLLERDRAVILRLGEQHWIRFRPRDARSALQLGYHAGNLHWRVRFDGNDLLVAQDAPLDDYLDRLESALKSGDVVHVMA